MLLRTCCRNSAGSDDGVQQTGLEQPSAWLLLSCVRPFLDRVKVECEHDTSRTVVNQVMIDVCTYYAYNRMRVTGRATQSNSEQDRNI